MKTRLAGRASAQVTHYHRYMKKRNTTNTNNTYAGKVIKRPSQRLKHLQEVRKSTSSNRRKQKRLDPNSECSLAKHTNGYTSLQDYKAQDKSHESSPALSIAFVSRSIDEFSPPSLFGPSLGLMSAVARVFAEHVDKLTPKHWGSLFLSKDSDKKFRNRLLHLIGEAFMAEFDYRKECSKSAKPRPYATRYPYDSSNRYKDIRDRFNSIGTANTLQRNIFARYLLKLCDAKYGCASNLKRRHLLGSDIVQLGKWTTEFPKPENWKKKLCVPTEIDRSFMDVLASNVQDGGEGYDTENDDPDGDKVQTRQEEQEQVVKTGYYRLGELQEELQKLLNEKITFSSRVGALSKQLDETRQKIGTIAAEIRTKKVEIKEEEKYAEKKCFENYAAAKQRLGGETFENVIKFASNIFKQLYNSKRQIKAKDLAKEFVMACGFGEDRVTISDDRNKDVGDSGDNDEADTTRGLHTNTLLGKRKHDSLHRRVTTVKKHPSTEKVNTTTAAESPTKRGKTDKVFLTKHHQECVGEKNGDIDDDDDDDEEEELVPKLACNA